MAGKPGKKIIEQFVADTHVLDTHALATKYGKAESTIREWRKHCERVLELSVGYGSIPQADVKIWDDFEVLQGDVMVIGDLEIPYHDAELVGRMLAVAKRFDIKQLVIHGDLWAFDFLSHWPREAGQVEPDDHSEFSEAKRVLKALLTHFEKIVVTKGNHEQRATRKGFSMKTLQVVMGLDDRVTFSHYMYCEVESAGERFLIVHPQDYSSQRGKIPADLADVEDIHVLSGHTHTGGISFSRNAKFIGLDLGHATRPETRHYAMQGKRKSPKWVSGFGMVRNGYAYAFYEGFTDWSFWLDETA